MDLFFDIALSFPTVILSVLLAVALGYWALALLGLFELDLLGGDLAAGDGLSGGELTGLLMKLGLDGVPLSLILTVITLIAWLACYFFDYAVLRAWPDGTLLTAATWLAAPISLIVATPFAGLVLHPMRPLFAETRAMDDVSLLGRVAVIRSPTVDEKRGQAEVDDGGAGLILQVRAPAGRFVRGDRVLLAEYVPADNTFKVIPEGNA